jgi:hypothetical protein
MNSTGIITEYDIVDGLFVAKSTQDVEAVIEQNKAERLSGDNDRRNTNMRKVASIPLIVVQQLRNRSMKDGGPIDLNLLGIDVEHTVRFNRWLNDRDNEAFRTNNARQ